MRSFTAPNGMECKKRPAAQLCLMVPASTHIPSGNVVYKGGEDAGFVSWCGCCWTLNLFYGKKRNAGKQRCIVKLCKDGDSCPYITTKAAGNFMNDYLRNENIGGWQPGNMYLTGKAICWKTLKIFYSKKKNETLIFSLDTIEYNTNIPLSEFSFSIPAGAELKQPWFNAFTKDATTGISSTVVARMALEDLSKGDFETHKYLWSQYSQLSL